MTTYRRPIVALFLAMLMLIPMGACAESLSAGIPAGNIWLSKNTPTEGDPVRISLPVYNAGTTKISGDAIFSVDGTQVGTAHFELDVGNSTIVSSPWTATKGAHNVTARLEGAIDSKTGTGIAVSANTQSLPITVSERPPAPAVIQAVNTVAAVAQNTASAALPIVGSVAGAVFDKTEELRKAAAASLEMSLTESENNTPASLTETTETKGQVLSAEIHRTPIGGDGKNLAAAAITAPSSHGAMRIFEQTLLFIVSYTWVFYPLLLLILLGLLYLIAKNATRKKPKKA